MRYDKEIFFLKEGEKAYNTDTGDYSLAEPTKTKRMASIYDTGTESMNLVYGKIRQGSLTIHLQTAFEEPFDFIIVKDKKYKVDLERNLRRKQSFIVSEVP